MSHWHDDVIKWKHFPRYWPFVRGIHRSPLNSPHKGQWRRALMFTLICVWINGCVNNREAGDLRRYCAHNGVTVIESANIPTHCGITLSTVIPLTTTLVSFNCMSVNTLEMAIAWTPTTVAITYSKYRFLWSTLYSFQELKCVKLSIAWTPATIADKFTVEKSGLYWKSPSKEWGQPFSIRCAWVSLDK